MRIFCALALIAALAGCGSSGDSICTIRTVELTEEAARALVTTDREAAILITTNNELLDAAGCNR